MGSQKLKINNLIRFEFFKDVITTEGELLRKKDHTWSKKARLIRAPSCGGWINPFEGRVMNPIKKQNEFDKLVPLWKGLELRRGCQSFWGGLNSYMKGRRCAGSVLKWPQVEEGVSPFLNEGDDDWTPASMKLELALTIESTHQRRL